MFHEDIQEKKSNKFSRKGESYPLQNRLISELSEVELLALILRTSSKKGGTTLEQAQKIKANFPTLLALQRAGVGELKGLSGLNESKTLAIKAALELGRRLILSKEERKRQFTSSYEIFELYHARFKGEEQENFWCLLLDYKNRPLRHLEIAKGKSNLCSIDPIDIFAPAIRERALKLILIHNHPSGDPEPSSEDRILTSRIQEVAKLIGIKVLDHLIIGDHTYVSFAERGWL